MRLGTETAEAAMNSVLKAGQTLRGRLSTYTLAKELYRSDDNGAVFLARQVHFLL